MSYKSFLKKQRENVLQYWRSKPWKGGTGKAKAVDRTRRAGMNSRIDAREHLVRIEARNPVAGVGLPDEKETG